MITFCLFILFKKKEVISNKPIHQISYLTSQDNALKLKKKIFLSK